MNSLQWLSLPDLRHSIPCEAWRTYYHWFLKVNILVVENTFPLFFDFRSGVETILRLGVIDHADA